MMILVIVICIFLGAILALVLQAYFLYVFFFKLPELKSDEKPRRSSECKLPEELLKIVNNGSWKDQKESCVALNLIFQFLFNEWKNTKMLRRWLIKKLNGEFLEMQKTTTGRLLENITVRDLQLGSGLPVLKNISVQDIVLDESKDIMQELTLVMEMEYGGGFELSVDVDMVLGRSASVTVRVSKLQGKARLNLTRFPFSHWSFSFTEEPHIDFAVASQFQGRQMPQVTSLIVRQIRRAIRKKHTLPNYKIRFRPFFPSPQVSCAEAEPLASEGILEVLLVKCARLCTVPPFGSLYCTMTLDEKPWEESSLIKDTMWCKLTFEMNYKEGQLLGLVLKQEFIPEKMDNCVVIKNISPNSCAFSSGMKKGDILASIGKVKITHMKHVTKMLKPSDSMLVINIERKVKTKELTQNSEVDTNSCKHSQRKSVTKETASGCKLYQEIGQTLDSGMNSEKVWKSSLVKVSKEPKWNETFTLNLLPHHSYLNVGVLCSSEQSDILLGRVSISVVSVVEDCAFTSLGIHSQNFQLLPPNSLLDRQWSSLSKHRGFDCRLCCGEVFLEFKNQEDDNFTLKDSSRREIFTELDEEPIELDNPASDGDDTKHNFVSTQFTSGTLCHFCRKKIWLKVAYKCCNCAMICHKKCVQKCRQTVICPHEGITFEVSVPVNPHTGLSVDGESLPQNISDNSTSQSGSPQCSRRNLQGFLSNIASASQRRSSLARTGSTHNLAPPSSNLAPTSRSLPPSPHHSPAQSRKCSLQEALFPWLDPTVCEEQDVDVILEQLLTQPHNDSLLALVKERGKDLYRKLPLEERKAKLNKMITKIKESMDNESLKRSELSAQERSASPVARTKLAFLMAKCNERTQGLETLMLLYFSGLQHCMDIEPQQPDFSHSNIHITAPSPSLETMLQGPLLCIEDPEESGQEGSNHNHIPVLVDNPSMFTEKEINANSYQR